MNKHAYWFAGIVAGGSLLGMGSGCFIRVSDGGSGGATSSSVTNGTTTSGSTTSGSTTSGSTSSGVNCPNNGGMACFSCSKYLMATSLACCSSNCPDPTAVCKGTSADLYSKLSTCACAACVSQCGANCDSTAKACDDCFADVVFNSGSTCKTQRDACNAN